jgi:hypothetical protein
MQKPEIDSTVSALCAYTRVSITHRRLLKRELCTNPCIDKVISDLFNTDESRNEYDTMFSVISPRDVSTVIADSKNLRELKDAVEYYIHGIEILKAVKDSQVEYMARMFYKLCKIIHPFYVSPSPMVRSPPRKR